MRGALFSALLALAAPAQAQVKPVPRPLPPVEVLAAEGAVQVAGETSPATSVRPVPRLPEAVRASREVAALIRSPVPHVDVSGRVRVSMRPAAKPAVPAPAPAPVPAVAGTVAPPAASDGSGGLCGRSSIRGEVIAPVAGAGGCGIDAPVRVTAVSGLALTVPARIDCTTAVALDDWVRSGVIPAVGPRGGGAAALEIAGSYACRGRNNQAGARLSEHARGRAVDVSAIRLRDGTALSVARDWGGGPAGEALRAMWRAACGPFGTVLGPGSDPYHDDHLHLDTARERRAPYCR